MSFTEWLIFGHVLAVLAFFLAHGASAISVIRLRREREPVRVKAMLDLSQTGNIIADISGLVLIVFGVWIGIVKGQWTNGQLWLWLSTGLLVLVIVVMGVLTSRTYYGWRDLWKNDKEPTRAELEVAMDTNQPLIGAILGLVGVVAILWLMMARPF